MTELSSPILSIATGRDAAIQYADFLASADHHDAAVVEDKTAELVSALFEMWPASLPIRKKKVVVACRTLDQEAFAKPLVALLENAEAKVSVIDFKDGDDQVSLYSEPLPSIADVLMIIAPTMVETSALAVAGCAYAVKPDKVVILTPAYPYHELSNIQADVISVVGSSQSRDLKIEDAHVLGISCDDWLTEADIDDEIIHAAEVISEHLAIYRERLVNSCDKSDQFASYHPSFLSTRNMRDRLTWPVNVDGESDPEVIDEDNCLHDLLSRYKPEPVADLPKSGLLSRLQLRTDNVSILRQNSLKKRLMRLFGLGQET